MQEFTGYKGYLPSGPGALPDVLPTSAADRVNFFYSAVYWYRHFTPEQPLNPAFDALDTVRESALRGAQSIDTQRIKQAVDDMTPMERVRAIVELSDHTPWGVVDLRGEESKRIDDAVAAMVAAGPLSLPGDSARPDREPIAAHLPDGGPNRIEMFYEIARRYIDSSSLTSEQSDAIQRALGVRADALERIRWYEQGSHDQTAFHIDDAQRFDLMDRLAPEVAASARSLNPTAGEFATEAVSRFTKAREEARGLNMPNTHEIQSSATKQAMESTGSKMEAQFVSVSNGTRRVDAPDGEGYLKAIERGPSNGLPNGRYNLGEAIEAAREIGHEYHGQVLHKDSKHLFQLVGKEIIKHELTEAALEQAPEIGKALAVTYSGAGPHFDPLSIDGLNTAAEQSPNRQTESELGASGLGDVDAAESDYNYFLNQAIERGSDYGLPPAAIDIGVEAKAAREASRDAPKPEDENNATHKRTDEQQQRRQADVADTPRNEVRADLIELFTHDPQGIDKFVAAEEGDMKASPAGAKLEEMQGKLARNIDYAYELKSVHPDLFGKLADDAIKAKVMAHEKYDALAQKRDVKQSGTAADERERSRERTQEQERGNRQAIGSVRTSVEARAHEAREVLSRSAGLAPMVAVNAMKNNSNAQQSKGPSEQTKAKRGMSM